MEPAPHSGMTGQQKALLALFVFVPVGCFLVLVVLMFVAGVIAGALSAAA